MLELTIVACLLEDPARCREVSLTYMAEGMTPMQCMMMAPPEIAKYTEGHPKWFAKKWRCQPAGRYARI